MGFDHSVVRHAYGEQKIVQFQMKVKVKKSRFTDDQY